MGKIAAHTDEGKGSPAPEDPRKAEAPTVKALFRLAVWLGTSVDLLPKMTPKDNPDDRLNKDPYDSVSGEAQPKAGNVHYYDPYCHREDDHDRDKGSPLYQIHILAPARTAAPREYGESQKRDRQPPEPYGHSIEAKDH